MDHLRNESYIRPDRDEEIVSSLRQLSNHLSMISKISIVLSALAVAVSGQFLNPGLGLRPGFAAPAFAGRYAYPAPFSYARAPVAVAHPAPVAVAHAPVAVAHAAVDEYDPHPQYSFHYEVNDPLTGDSKHQSESRDGDVVQGTYSLAESDGSIRTVDYTADPVNGFNAVVHKDAAAHPAPVVGHAPAVVAHAPVAVAAPAPVAFAGPAHVGYAAAPSVAYASRPVGYGYSTASIH